VLRTDLADDSQQGRAELARELIALGDLAAAHRQEFRRLMESEAVLAALAAMTRPGVPT
jgi:hypothetical protein